MDEVFRALNDPSRRLLLDRLFEEDGPTLAELCVYLPEMTRFGVMNHLRVLEEAGLVVTKKVGRSKHHYLNPVPIRLVHDRWISKYREAATGAIARMKAVLEGGNAMEKPVYVYQVYIRCRPEEAWQAIVDGDLTVEYFYGSRVESEWKPGAPVRYLARDGTVVSDGVVLAIEPGKRLDMTFHARWDDALEAEGPVRNVWEIDEVEGLTRVRCEYYEMQAGDKRYEDFSGGIPYIMSGLKTLLETGTPLAG
jgi:DNA-binding transcriptional ArsR family regulator/uncharacterized protein YndB with AHSA1/START domain